MAPAPTLMTVDEYLRTPETVRPMELAYGVLRVADAPSPRHQSVVLALCLALDRHTRPHKMGSIWIAPVDVVLDEDKALIVQPDLMFISNERAWIVKDRVRGAPDLVIEVLSPRPRIGETRERLGWFAKYGVRECWLVHQDRKDITVIEYADACVRAERVYQARSRIQSSVLPDFSMSFEEILDRS